MPFLLVLVLCITNAHGIIMPITKPDGSLDVSSLLSHIALLEQTIESKASAAETNELKSQLQTALSDLTMTQTQLETTDVQLKTTQDELKAAQIELAQFNTTAAELQEVKSDLNVAQTEIAQFKTTTADLKEVQSDIKATQIEVAVLQSQLRSTTAQCSCNTSLSQSSTDLSSLKTDVSTLKTDVFHLQSQRNATQQSGHLSGGATFTRWGRTTCPNDTQIIYKGYTGGTHNVNVHGSTATILCLPEHPIYAVHTSNSDHYHSYIYGTEYESNNNGDSFHNLDDENMPCVVCESEAKRSAIMVPARNQCYPGWNLEYSGYLMGARDDLASAEFICVDKDPEAIPGGHANQDGQLLYVVKSVCGSLPCLLYANYWELTCAVCSK